MAAMAASRRARAGASFVGIGALLVLVAFVLIAFQLPAAGQSAGFPNGSEDCVDGTATGGWKIGIDSDTSPPSNVVADNEASGVAFGDVTWSITASAAHPIVYTATNSTGYYLNYEYTGSGFVLYSFRIKTGASNPADDGQFFTSTNPGSIEIPSATSHITLCFHDETTTTTSTSTSTTSTSTSTTSTSTTSTSTTSTSTTSTSTSTTTTSTMPPSTTSTSTSTSTTSTMPPSTTTSSSTLPPDTTSTSTTTTTDPTTTTTPPATTTSTLPPELPRTGGEGNPLVILLGGLGIALLGAGLLMLAEERRHSSVAH